MAIYNKGTGNYLKVVRDLAIFTPRSVNIAFYDFVSKSARDAYFSRKQAVSSFVQRATGEILSARDVLNFDISEFSKIQTVESISDLSPELRARVDELDDLDAAVHNIGLTWDGNVIKPKKNLVPKLKSFGFDSAWCNALEPWNISTVNTGVYVNQDFTYECLYRELKKVYSKYVDC